ncbi:MAG: hypothetical protein P9L94_14050 [Candidatus Hinthialibacter antarcticus]|nr:hypothetical protein [Candidatus Hinthialibacter antarcticus]
MGRILLIIQVAIALFVVGWFLKLLNKMPGEIYQLRELREEKPDLFWAECLSYCFTWAICLILMAVFVVPFAMQIVGGWSKIIELF